jgi:hypothetical protein
MKAEQVDEGKSKEVVFFFWTLTGSVQVYENCVGCCMKPENESERQLAMASARHKKTFAKAVADKDAFEFCRCVGGITHTSICIVHVHLSTYLSIYLSTRNLI